MQTRIVTLCFLFLTPLAFAEGSLSAPGACTKNDSEYNSEEGGCLSFRSGLVWALAPRAATSLPAAERYCAELSEAGYEDWRLPDRAALSLESHERGALDHFSFKTIDVFWASHQGTGWDAWLVSLSDGVPAQESKTSPAGRAACVRQPADLDGDHIPDSSDRCSHTPPHPKKAVHTSGEWKGCIGGDTLVTAEVLRDRRASLGCRAESDTFQTVEAGCRDRTTGKIWSAVSREPIALRYSRQYCARLREGLVQGFSGWELPDAQELQGVSGAASAGKHFKGEMNRDFWSSRFYQGGHALIGMNNGPGGARVMDYVDTVNLLSGTPTRVLWKTSTTGFGGGTQVHGDELGKTASVICVLRPEKRDR